MLGVQRRRRARLGRVSAVIAISGAIRDELLGYGFPRERIAEIPNGVDVERFRPLSDASERSRRRAELGWPDAPTVVFVGELSRRKRLHLIVEAIGRLAARRSEHRAVFVGPPLDAAYAEEMRVAARSLGVEDRILWLGHLEAPDLLLPAADVFCLPSANEGMPNAMLEAMACGLPTLGTRISGIVDLLGDERGGAVHRAQRPLDRRCAPRVRARLRTRPAHGRRSAGARRASLLGAIRARRA
jgi:glycosyltransferase involved in cell wall biosynthesis